MSLRADWARGGGTGFRMFVFDFDRRVNGTLGNISMEMPDQAGLCIAVGVAMEIV